MLFLHQRQHYIRQQIIKSQGGGVGDRKITWWLLFLWVKTWQWAKQLWTLWDANIVCSRNHRLLWIVLWALWTQRAMHLIDMVPKRMTVTHRLQARQPFAGFWVHSSPQPGPSCRNGHSGLKRSICIMGIAKQATSSKFQGLIVF